MDMEVDWPAYEKARREEVLKGNYIQLEIIIPAVDADKFAEEGNSPICHLVQHNNTVFDVAVLYKTLELYMQNLEKKHPGIKEYVENTFGVKSIYEAEEEPNEAFIEEN